MSFYACYYLIVGPTIGGSGGDHEGGVHVQAEAAGGRTEGGEGGQAEGGGRAGFGQALILERPWKCAIIPCVFVERKKRDSSPS